uniref:Photosystem II reaction center protein Z n=1 Tax=Karlodinium veneficum TaxID=407301 RepID=A7WQ12_KARVE|nr:unknown [Karlodinium veneficum]
MMQKSVLVLACLLGVAARKPLTAADPDALAELLLAAQAPATNAARAKQLTRKGRMSMQEMGENPQQVMPKEAVQALGLATALAPAVAFADTTLGTLSTLATAALVLLSTVLAVLVPVSMGGDDWENKKGNVFKLSFLWIALVLLDGGLGIADRL